MNKVEKRVIVKSAEPTESDIALINEHTLKELKAEDVFLFRLVLCDNEVDRDFECFPTETIEKMAGFFTGKTIIKDHSWKSDDQIARIFKTAVEKSEHKATTGEAYAQLVATCYILRSEKNEAFISDIEGGIKAECSIACSVSAAVCSICGKDKATTICEHRRGESYDEKICHVKLKNPCDAYEVSFVAVPAQLAAGVKKEYGEEDFGRTPDGEKEEMSIKLFELYIFNEKRKEVKK